MSNPQTFYKYQGTGNDFILIDDRNQSFECNNAQLIRQLCDRKFGIGADGLILLRPSDEADFRMVYFNADGNESSMCGNGGRCIAYFSNMLGYSGPETTFIAIDGLHKATISGDIVALLMQDAGPLEIGDGHCVINTGSPHYVIQKPDLEDIDIIQEARKVRYSKRFEKEGINVNFLEEKEGELYVRTYERGVENETLSCGTGMVAATLYADALGMGSKTGGYRVNSIGGSVEVSFESKGTFYENIWLKGPVGFVFKGEINV